MIRTCDGNDANLKRQIVTKVAHSGQEVVQWVPCDCGTTFDDVERLVIYPHYYIPTREDKEDLRVAVQNMVTEGLSSEQIREQLQLTNQQAVNYSEGTEPQPNEGKPDMTESTDPRFGGDETATDSAEGVSTEAAEATDENATGDSTGDVGPNADGEQAEQVAAPDESEYRGF